MIKSITIITIIIWIFLILLAPIAWILMLLLGTFAHVSSFEQFALNFWSCYVIVVVITLFGVGRR